MFNFFKTKTTIKSDLELIKELEQTIGKKLPRIYYFLMNLVGYMQNEQNQITGLCLSECNLKEFPPEIGKLQNLTKLDLRSNQLSSLPPEFGQLQNLTELDLRSNQLSSLPPEFGQLQNLTKLALRSNQLTQFPKALLNLNLEVKWDNWKDGICVEDNPFQTPPVEIVKQGRRAIIDYYAALEE